ncbi:MAG: class I SAM-dependent methyltransferase [Bacteroidales bacterium]|nr:class I SAM-dependent methyltransferase [Bacteroidales bacterium]
MKTCAICNSTKIKLKFKLIHNVYACKSCGFQFAPDASFNNTYISDLDEVSRQKSLKNLRLLNFLKIIDNLKKHLNADANGLEVGSAHAWFLQLCKENNINCIGIEPEKRFNSLHEEMELTVINGFFPDDIPENQKFDFVAFNDVFEHLPDIEKVLPNILSLLNPKGKLLVNLPIREGAVYRVSSLAYFLGIKSFINRMWQFNFHSPHLSYFSKKNLLALAKNNDFEILEAFSLKTLDIKEIKHRISLDANQNKIKRVLTIFATYLTLPLFRFFPDTFCFIFEKR